MNVFLTSSVHRVAHDIAPKTHARKLAFINTAAEVEEGDMSWMQADRDALTQAGFDVTDYTFTDKKKEEVQHDLAKFEALYLEGGNTFYLLQQMQKSGAMETIRDLVEQGTVYIGTSAGSIVAGPDIAVTRRLENDHLAPDIDGYAGLGLVNFTVFPHWGSRVFRDLYLGGERLEQAYGYYQPFLLLNDSQYVWVQDSGFQIFTVARQ